MSKSTEILLIRHGETSWNAVKRLQGHSDIALNDQGQAQADALGLALRDEPLAAIISSDLQRARQTAQAVARQQAGPMEVICDSGLRERCYGAFEGLYYSDISQRYPAAFAAWQARDIDAVFPPGERQGESFRAFHARIAAAMLHWARRYPGQKIALVAHGGVLECAYRAALALPLSTPRDFPILNASINRFRLEGDALRLLSWGEVAHLDAAALDEVDQRVP
ncbi:histidine phosphatase family protein [Herminiimonas sp. CN]|uniref:histidine phosphatase family protein n=1 Tax=Herminiimonas sp. CN TaxID=1349818 RepID=UPI0004742E46|nr:histidine phosphatase family protein [Herminiimonas sp. CN]